MIVANTKEIRAMLKDFPLLVAQPAFTIDDAQYDRIFVEAWRQHPEEHHDKHLVHLRTIKRCLTLDKHKPKPVELNEYLYEFAEQQWWSNFLLVILLLTEIFQCFLLAEVIHVVAK